MNSLFLLVFFSCFAGFSMDNPSPINWASNDRNLIAYQLAAHGITLWEKSDYNNAIIYLGKAQDSGNAFAWGCLSAIHKNLLCSLASNPHTNTFSLLCFLYHYGWGVARNSQSAMLWNQMSRLPLVPWLSHCAYEDTLSTSRRKAPSKQDEILKDRLESCWQLYKVSHESINNFIKEKNRFKLKLRGSVWAHDSKISKILKRRIKLASYITPLRKELDGSVILAAGHYVEAIFKRKIAENYGYDVDGDKPCLLKPDDVKPLIYRLAGSEVTWELDTKSYIDGLLNEPAFESVFETEKYRVFNVTSNQMGDICHDYTYIIDQYNKSIQPGAKVLDLGCATGYNSYTALKKGAFVTALDYCLDHLAYLAQHTEKNLRKHLWLNNSSFPKETDFLPASKNIILMSQILHYLMGENLRIGLKKSYEWLDDDGLLFIQTLSPYAAPFVDNAMKADELFKKNEEWPGYFSHTYVNASMPDFGHPLHPAILDRELKNAGYEVVYINYGMIESDNIKPYPISYQEIDKYFRNQLNEGEMVAFETKLVAFDPLLFSRMKCDRQLYQNMLSVYGNSSSSSMSFPWPYKNKLGSIELVQAIAKKVKNAPSRNVTH